MLRKLVQIVTGRSDASPARALSSSSDARTTPIALIAGQADPSGRIASDRPIGGISGDLFGVSGSFVPRLARIAVDWAREDGFVIGMYGPWGVGKTSVLNLLVDYVEQNKKELPNVYVCQFNPWFYEDPRTLITSFFATIAAELGKDMRKPWARAATALRAMEAFLSVASRGVSMFGFGFDTGMFPQAARVANEAMKDTSAFSAEVGGFVDLVLGGQRKLEEHRTAVENALRQLGRSGGRVVVLVDDVDRLNRDELISLLRLVRIVADLPYISIILAVDDHRIREVLEHVVSEGYGKAYLDKIIQVGIHVPLPTRDAVREMLLKEFEAIFTARDIEFPEELGPSETPAHRGPLEAILECIHTPRDLARYRNSLSVLVLSGEEKPDIHPADAALIEALHVFYPHVYDGIRRRRRFLTHRLTSEQYRKRGKHVDEVRRQRREELDLIVHGGTQPTLDRLDQRTVHALLHHLFGEIVDPEKISPDTNESILRRIRSNLAFDSYFRFANTSLVPRAVVDELLDDLIALSEVETSEQLAERIVTYLVLDH